MMEETGHFGMKRLVLSVAILLVLFLAACGNGERDNPGATACREVVSSTYGLWSEFLDPEEVIEQGPSLKRHEISLYQNIRNEDIGNEKVATLFREASRGGHGSRYPRRRATGRTKRT